MRTTTRGQATSARLLDAALAVHAEDGTDGITVQAVLDRSGVSLGSLYHHFGSLGGLAAALYARCLGELLDAVLADLRRSRTAATGVRAVVAAYLRHTREHPDAARFVHASSYAAFLPAHAPRIAAEVAPRTGELHAWFAAQVAAGRVVDAPADVLEVLVVGPPAELARRWLAGGPGIDLAGAQRTLPELVWRSVRAG
ncbi:TetR/AcrR family transcriptional regulator [Blastococcus sp. SYSU D00820]